MTTFAICQRPPAHRATQPVLTRRQRECVIEPLEARVAPATVAALPGNSNFEDPTDFAKWTVDAGPGSVFVEYVTDTVETTVVRGALAPEGAAYAHLSFEGRVAPTTTGYGPSLQSEIFTATANEKISVTWRATNSGDVAHPRGRLFTAAGAPVATFFDSDTGTTSFDTSTVSVPLDGQYYLLFEAGSSDVSIGGLVGAKLDIDAVHRTPSGVSVQTLGNGQLSVDVSSESASSNSPNAFLVTLDDTGEYVEIFVNGSLDFVQPLSSIDRINVLGRGGNDQLTVDSSHGLIGIAEGINFDGGGALDTLSLIQTGGPTRAGHVFSPAEGISQIGSGVTAQIVNFLNAESVQDNVPTGSLIVNGTLANNSISSTAGAGGGSFTGATGKVTVDSFASIEFNNKTSLTINALAGSDTISLNNPAAPAGLTTITVNGSEPALVSGDSLSYQQAGSIQVSAAGAGTIASAGLPTVNFTGIEVAATAGFTIAPGAGGLAVTATGDQSSAGQDDAFIITTNSADQFLRVALNGSVGLYAYQGAIARIDAVGLGGTDSLTLIGTSLAETFTFVPTAADAGGIGITGVVVAGYTAVESVALNAMGGDDLFAIGGAVGTVQIIGGSGSDRIDFSTAASRIVFDLDSVGFDQFVNATGQAVSLGDVIENFTGSAFNDTLSVNAANFPRDLKGGANTNEVFPPGDELSFDGQAKVVLTTLVSASTGTYKTAGFSDVTFAGFETPLIANSPSGPGFGTPETSNAYDAAHVYRMLNSKLPNGKAAPGRAPSAVATADLNGDGYMDMVVVNSASGSISVLLNVGDGTFGNPVAYKTRGTMPRDVVLGNFDANPGLDAAVTNRATNTLALFSGDTLGGFATPTLIRTAYNPSAITVGRVDGNTIDDLVIAHPLGNKISVLLGTGNGFEPADTFRTVGLNPIDVVIGDFNGDGKADVATANRNSNDVSLFQGDGLGGMAAPTRYATGKRPNSLAAADFDLDGITDLAVSNQSSNYVSILFSKGAAGGAVQFQTQLQVALPGQHAPTAIIAADLNGDGLADLALGSAFTTDFTVLIGGNLGKFSLPYEFDLGTSPQGPKFRSLAIADFNNDGLLDAVATGIIVADARVLLRKF